ncbi:nucleotide sugar dehydrogenase [Desulfobacterota bacterium AH_259_B03_O07]|nr:nucleotide sugar dehydrogenase [Desulfobacterota bacterium AH_259_B03_O07]
MEINSESKVAVIGLGYVGLPLALAFAEKGVKVFGIDIDSKKVSLLKKGKSYIEDLSDDDISKNTNNFFPTTDYSVISRVDAAIVCVPTPLSKTKEPDISYIAKAVKLLSKHIHSGMLVVLESTTYPGTTEEILKPLFEERGLKLGSDIFLAYSPERIDPGNKNYKVNNIPKVVGGITKECTDYSVSLYEMICDEVFPVTSPRVAEATKLLENTFRSVNTALVNEFAQLCHRIGIDIWEVIDAASTKPFGFMSFHPGAGIGGHCIPVDPLYLSWKAELSNFTTRLIYLADDINRKMPEYVLYRLFEVLNKKNKSVKDSKILVLGVSYKPDIGDIRESPAVEVIKLILEKGGHVSYNDPYIPYFDESGKRWESVNLNEELLRMQDIILIITKHSSYEMKWIVDNGNCILDCQNHTNGIISSRINKL